MSVEVHPLVSSVRMAVGERGRMDVRFVNRGSRALDSAPPAGPPIRASCRWVDARGTVVISDGPRTPFPAPVEPGESVVVALDLAVPVRPGRYTVEIDVVEEGVRWFGRPASAEITVTVPAALRARYLLARLGSRGPAAIIRRRRTFPRAIHRIWLGDATLPDEYRHYGETWRRQHPGWELRLWGDREVARLVPARCVRRSRSRSEASNLVRYEILRRYGGVYADTDVECRRSLEPLLEGVQAFAAWETPHRMGTAILGSTPGHPLFELAARESRLSVGTGLSSVEATGPGLLTQIVAGRRGMTVFDSELFYPYRWDEPERRHEEFPRSYAVHHWAGSWAGDS